MKKYLLTFVLLAAIAFFQIPQVFAQTGGSSNNPNKERVEQKLKALKLKFASKSALRKEKLEATKLKVCNTKKTNIVRRSTRLAERAQRQLDNFTQKAERVQKYYTDKLVPKGVTVSNYDDLLAEIESRAQAVEEATSSAKQAAEDFDCSADDPKGQLANYRTDMQNAIQTLKEYRTAIKNLIVAVRTAVAKAATSSATPSANN